MSDEKPADNEEPRRLSALSDPDNVGFVWEIPEQLEAEQAKQPPQSPPFATDEES